MRSLFQQDRKETRVLKRKLSLSEFERCGVAKKTRIGTSGGLSHPTAVDISTAASPLNTGPAGCATTERDNTASLLISNQVLTRQLSVARAEIERLEEELRLLKRADETIGLLEGQA